MLPTLPPELLAGARNRVIDYHRAQAGDQVVIPCGLGSNLDTIVVRTLGAVCHEDRAEVRTVDPKRLLNTWWESLPPTVRPAIGVADVGRVVRKYGDPEALFAPKEVWA